MKKSLFCLLLSAALLLSLFPAALAEEIRLVDPEQEREGAIRLVGPANEAEAPAVSMSTGGVTLRWSPVAGAERYEVLRLAGEDWLPLDTVAEPAYTDAAVRMGERYDYRVRAFDGEGWTLCGEAQGLLFNPFADVSGAKTVEYVAWAYNSGLVRGVSETGFSPDAPCSRVQFVMILWKMNGSPEPEGENPFADVSGAQTTKAVLWALQAGVINSGRRFDPDGSITRAQVVMILWKLAGCPETGGELPFTDVSGAKTQKAVRWAFQNGIVKGTGEARFSPGRACTRVQLVVLLYKFDRRGQEARQLALSVRYRDTERPAAADGDYNSSFRVPAGKSLALSAGEEIYALYIVWEEYPQPWTLRSGGREERHGENGFLHELVRLENPAAELELQVSGSRSQTVADIYAFSAGALPAWVQDWQQPWDEADLLLVPTHSDDEFIFMGGVIPKYVDRGMRVQVVYLIGHGQPRWHERLNSLWEAGVDHVPIVGSFRDQRPKSVAEAKWLYDVGAMTEYLVEQLRRFKPKVVVGHAEDGDSGHPVHILNVMCLKDALTLAAKPGAYPASEERYGLYEVPKLYLHLYGPAEEMTVLDYETPLSRFGGRTAFQVACDAFARCVTQIAAGTYRVYGADSPHDTHKWGLYRSLVGPDEAKDDLFEHLD